MPITAKKRSGYPYKIPVPPSNLVQPGRKLPLMVNQFFLAEALLRSHVVMRAYRRGKSQLLSCLMKHGIPFDPLSKIHHFLLTTDTTPSLSDKELDEKYKENGFVADDILDLSIASKREPSAGFKEIGAAAILKQLCNPAVHHMYLRLDISKSWNAIKNQLEPIFQARHAQFNSRLQNRSLPDVYLQTNRTPFRNITAWLDFFHAFDLRHDQHMTYGQIAAKIYKTSTARDRAKKAVLCVKRVIHAAETNNWPPVDPTRSRKRAASTSPHS